MTLTRTALIIVALLFALGATSSCSETPCANDGDCPSDSVCLVDVDGPHCEAARRPRSRIVVRELRAQIAPLAHGGRLTMRAVAVEARP